MTRRNFIILYIGILLFFLALTSCGSKKQCVVLPSDFKGPKELSRLYGVRLTPNDNIFLYNEGARWLGVPHRMGGLTKKGVDCSGRAKEGRKCLTMSGSIWKMVSLSIPAHRTVWSSVAWVNLTMSGHGLLVAGWRICDFLWITRLFYVKTTIK